MKRTKEGEKKKCKNLNLVKNGRSSDREKNIELFLYHLYLSFIILFVYSKTDTIKSEVTSSEALFIMTLN